MAFENLAADILELFVEKQEAFYGRVKGELLYGAEGDGSTRRKWGFRTFNPNPLNTAERMRAKARHQELKEKQEIRERLLAGERPKLVGSGCPPKRWFQAAKELGIDLKAPDPSKTAERQRDKYRQKIRERILAGERPNPGSRRPPTCWYQVAEELGIDLRAPVSPLGS